jgi:hypothetical protein
MNNLELTFTILAVWILNNWFSVLISFSIILAIFGLASIANNLSSIDERLFSLLFEVRRIAKNQGEQQSPHNPETLNFQQDHTSLHPDIIRRTPSPPIKQQERYANQDVSTATHNSEVSKIQTRAEIPNEPIIIFCSVNDIILMKEYKNNYPFIKIAVPPILFTDFLRECQWLESKTHTKASESDQSNILHDIIGSDFKIIYEKTLPSDSSSN